MVQNCTGFAASPYLANSKVVAAFAAHPATSALSRRGLQSSEFALYLTHLKTKREGRQAGRIEFDSLEPEDPSLPRDQQTLLPLASGYPEPLEYLLYLLGRTGMAQGDPITGLDMPYGRRWDLRSIVDRAFEANRFEKKPGCLDPDHPGTRKLQFHSGPGRFG